MSASREECCSICGIISLFNVFNYVGVFNDDAFNGLKKFYGSQDDNNGKIAKKNANIGLIPSKVKIVYQEKHSHGTIEEVNSADAKGSRVTSRYLPVFETVSSLTNWTSSNSRGEYLLPTGKFRPGIFHDMNYFLSILGVKFVRHEVGHGSPSPKRSVRWDKGVVTIGDNHLLILNHECKAALMHITSGESSTNLAKSTGSPTRPSSSSSSSRKSNSRASTVMLSPREFRNVVKHSSHNSNTDSPGLDNNQSNNEKIGTEYILGRPFHRSKLSSIVDTMNDGGGCINCKLNVDSVILESGSSEADAVKSPRSSNNDLQNLVKRNLQSTEGSMFSLLSGGKLASVEHSTIVMLQQKTNITIALSEVLQLQGASLDAIEAILALISEVEHAKEIATLDTPRGASTPLPVVPVVIDGPCLPSLLGRDVSERPSSTTPPALLTTLPPPLSEAHLSPVKHDDEGTGEMSSPLSSMSEWNMLLMVCHRRLGTVYKIANQLDKAELHLMEFFKLIRFAVYEELEPLVMTKMYPSATLVDVACACSLLSLVLLQMDGRELDSSIVHRQSISVTNLVDI